MPTTWHSDDEVEEVHGLVDLLLDECTYNSILPLLGGDFNARLGACENGDDSAVLGTWGLGRRNARGQLLARWVLQHFLSILSRLETNMPMAESWTCKRVADNALTQLDFIIGGLQFEHEKSWHDNCLGTGLDHRCVHSILKVRIAKRSLTKRISGLKNWQPFVDNDGKASGFQSTVRKLLRTNTNPTLPALERMLLTAGREHGQCNTVRFTFRPSRRLRGLCSMRRSTADVAMRKMPSFEIRRLHRQEIRFWKNSRLRQSLGRASHWKALRNMIHTSAGQAYASQPPLAQVFSAHASFLGLCVGVSCHCLLSRKLVLKSSSTKVKFEQENPKTPGSKAYQRYDKYKSSNTIGEATHQGANWQDLTVDFEKGWLTIPESPGIMEVDVASGAKRAHTEGTPDREATSRAKALARETEHHQHVETQKVEMSPATIMALRMMLREEVAAIEENITNKVASGIHELKEELRQEKEARKELEERIAKLENDNKTQRTAALPDDVDIVEKDRVVIGGFSDMDGEEAEKLVHEVLLGVPGYQGAYATNPGAIGSHGSV